MAPTAGNNVIDISAAGANASWSNAELHASMQKHFSLWSDLQQWCVWQLVAQQHDLGTGLYGIMFDQEGKQRQGCAVFHAGIGGTTAEQLRLQLYTYVHELGHCFNLMHSWQKLYASPPKPNRPDALSWMNYPWYYPKGGASGYWSSFDFRFDDEELIHLRHGFRNDVILGGSDFTAGASLGREIMADPISDESGLILAISTHKPSFALGEPVVLELKLKATDTRGRRAHTWLHPNYGLVKIVVSKPGGQVVAYEPLIDHLVGDRQTVLGVGDEIADSAYIGYGKGGFYFDQPGQYRVRAAYAALDGSQVLSAILTIRVRYPVSQDEDKLAELFMGDAQGQLLYLKGSDNDTLRSGNDAFDEVLARFGTDPMATYVRMIKGVNAGRAFRTIDPTHGKLVTVRPAHADESIALLSTVTDAQVLDPVTTGEVVASLACVQRAIGDDKAAQATLARTPAKRSRKQAREPMVRQLWGPVLPVLLLVLLAGQACEHRSLSGHRVSTIENTGNVMNLRVRLGEGFQNDTVSVRIDGKEVFRRAGVSTDWTISRADSVDIPLQAASVQLEVAVEHGPRVVQEIAPAQTPFVEVRLVGTELQLLPLNEEPPML